MRLLNSSAVIVIEWHLTQVLAGMELDTNEMNRRYVTPYTPW